MERLLREYRAAIAFRDERADESLSHMHPGAGGAETAARAVKRWYALGLLTLINLLNYIDRNVIYALFEPIKRDLSLTDSQLGWLGSAYILVFSVSALPFGVLSDLRSRRAVIAGGVTLWSAFTFLSGLVSGFGQLFTCRAAVGIGEAAYGPAAASLVADYFPGRRRAIALGILASGVALGGVLGLLLGGSLEGLYGWRVAFMTVAAPGFICAVLVARLPDPTRIASNLSVRSFLRNFHLGAAPLLRQVWPLLAGVGVGAMAAYLLDRHYGADSKLDVAALGTAIGVGLALTIWRWVRRTPAEEVELAELGTSLSSAFDDIVRAGKTVLHTPIAHVHLRRGGDDLLRHQRDRGVGADVRVARAPALGRRVGGAARQVGVDRGDGGYALRRGAGRLAPPTL